MKRIPVFICVAMLLLLSDAIMVFYQTLKEINTIEAICELEKGKDPLTTPLMVAIKAGASQRIINSFIKKTSNINAENANGFNALTTAVICATDTSIIETLIKNGADANYQNKDKLTPMQIAAKYATNPDTIEKLVKNGANIEKHITGEKQTIEWWEFKDEFEEKICNDSYYTPLLIASKYNKTPIVEALLKNGADKSTEIYGQNSLILALKYNPNDSTAISLLNYGFNPNSKEDTEIFKNDSSPALLLSSHKSLPIIKTLIEKGANLKDLDNYGNNIFLLACQNNSMDVLEYLYNNKSIETNHVNKKGLNALLICCENMRVPDRSNKIKFLIKKGFSINFEDNDGETAIHKLSKQDVSYSSQKVSELIDSISILIKSGANINHKSKKGLTPLLTAAYNTSCVEVIDLLLNSGANINDTDAPDLKFLETRPCIEKLLYPNNDNVLMCALRNPRTNEKIINRILTTGIDINYQNNFHMTPLFVACKNIDSISIAKLLISKGANINHSASGITPLMFATYHNNLELINILLKLGANKNLITPNGDNLLLIALSHHLYHIEPKVIERLIELGQDVNCKNKTNKTPILLLTKIFFENMPSYYAEYGLEDSIINEKLEDFKHMFELLIQSGANINIRDDSGQTPLFKIASYDATGEIIKLFLKSGADLNKPDKEGNTPIFEAVKYNNPQILNLLIASGANINKKNNNGESPLFMCAFSSEYHDVFAPTYYYISDPVSALKILLNNNINLNNIDNKKYHIFHYFIMHSYRNNIEFIKELLKQGVDIEIRGGVDAVTPLMVATINNRITYAKTLIAHGANVNSRDCDGYTPFMYAILGLEPNRNDFTMLDLLINSKANIQSKTDYNQTALTIACKDGKNPEVITYLLKHGINPRTKDSSGKTALDYLIKNPNLKDTKAYWELKQALNTK